MREGARLGPYALVAPIGAGGMGEVWRASDTRLERGVAVKILPHALMLRQAPSASRIRFELAWSVELADDGLDLDGRAP